MSEDQGKSLALFLTCLVLMALAVGLLDAWLYWRGGEFATFSSAMDVAGRHSPLFVAGVCLTAGAVVGGLVVHWWGW